MKLLVATRNAHKMVEIRRLLADCEHLHLLDLEGAGIPPAEEEEDLEPYDSFEANARSKARYFRKKSGLPTVADDSGLEVDALDGAPGVHSKRFAPERELEGTDRDRANNEYLLERLAETLLSDRTARFACVAVLDRGQEEVEVFRGEAPGLILGRPRGEGGFGYDPLFYDPALGKTFAEISREEKNQRSHRGQAFRALGRYLKREDRREGSE